jgi:hypothetical protein
MFYRVLAVAAMIAYTPIYWSIRAVDKVKETIGQ